MPQHKIVVSRLDRTRLQPHLADAAAHGPAASRLRDLLDRALPVAPQRVPPDVVTMNSRVAVRDGRGDDAEVYVLAYPEYDGPRAVYVLSPLGAALLAAREGDRIQYMGATGGRSALVEAIEYQPERSGDFDL
jgi:regulator of nucleoside diphosphate kinase